MYKRQAVINTTATSRSLILWDTLSTEEKETLITFVNNHGGTLPLSTPTSGHQTIDFGGNVVGINATGLSNVATAAAVATINLGGAKVGTDPSGLSSASTSRSQIAVFNTPIAAGTSTGIVASGTSGYQTIVFSVPKTGTDATGLSVVSTSGYTLVQFTGPISGMPTGLANDNTIYTAMITVDSYIPRLSLIHI